MNPIGSTYNPFLFEAEALMKQRSPPLSRPGSLNNLNTQSLIGTTNPLRPQLTGEPIRSTFPEPLRNQHTGPSAFGGHSTGFGSAFDGGLGARPMPYQVFADRIPIANHSFADEINYRV